MYAKQISVFIENRHGKLAEFTNLLADAGIDLIALSIADTTNFGILRAIVSETDRAYDVIKEAGYAASLTDVLAVGVPDQPGGLSAVLVALEKADISVEYLYSFVRNVQENAVIIFRVSEPEKAKQVLGDMGVRLLSQDEIATA
jgi:hypothetical protein